MRDRRLKIRNFRGVSNGTVDFPQHTLLGGSNVGKSTVCEALELVLGPERLGRRPVIEEHDFHVGGYLEADRHPVEITITAVLTEISEEARNRFHLHLRPWHEGTGEFADETGGPVTSTPVWALPVTFIGRYDRDEDDFVGNTFFDHPAPSPATPEDAQNEPFTLLGAGRTTFGREQKRYCGFVFLRALRTGSTLNSASLPDSWGWRSAASSPQHRCPSRKPPSACTTFYDR
jgi:putative ATP-dependent endonuclease of OLD family